MRPLGNYDTVAMLSVTSNAGCSEWEENLNMSATVSATRSISAIPQRSPSQRLDALSRANDTRKKRSELKREIKARRVDAGSVLQKVPGYCRTMKVSELLLAIPQVGEVKCGKIMARARIHQSRTLTGISEGQRADLLLEI